jgi:hypothetical protein
MTLLVIDLRLTEHAHLAGEAESLRNGLSQTSLHCRSRL